MSEYLKANEIIAKINEFQNDFTFKTKLQVSDQIISTTKYKNQYLTLSMRDITSELRKIKKWINEGEELDSLRELFDIGSILEIDGKYDKEYYSISINNARKLSSSEFNLEDYVKLPNINKEKLIEKLYETISKIKYIYLKELLKKIFNDDIIKNKYFECPSSIKIHHPYQCGNLEHTIGMITIFEKFVDFYERNTNLNIDLIYTGILLHDIGKIYEFVMYNGIPKKNMEYTLYSHLILGDQLISKIITKINDFPKDLENRVRHIILSHHGRKEWGSPVEPQFLEAEIIHYLDMIDSRFKSNL